ncbi:MAG: hypothetical protein E7342_01810 [Clostridiales bacterium]|nr:hypothetical protein [Clostridiales bacterium]
MKKIVEKIFFALLNFELSKKEVDNEIKNLITTDSLTYLYKLSIEQDLAHLIADSLEQNNLLCDEKLKNLFLKERNKAIFRDEQRKHEFESISNILKNVGIPFIPLKGIIISKLYPETWMRTSCDIDILINKNNLVKVKELLVTKLNYMVKGEFSHDVSLWSQSGVHLELHFSLTDKGDTCSRVLKDVWHYVNEDNDYKLDNDFLYFYHVSHLAKHFKSGGLGVRFFIDEWLLRNKFSYTNKKDILLSECGLLTFANEISKTTDCWFLGEKETDISLEIKEFVLHSGLYGNIKNQAVIQINKKGKLGYILSKIFLPYDELKCQYQVLIKRKWLMPFCQIARWFRLLLGKSKAQTKIKLNTLQNNDKSQANIKDLFDKLEI